MKIPRTILCALLSSLLLAGTVLAQTGSKTVTASAPSTTAVKVVTSNSQITGVQVTNVGSIVAYLGGTSGVTASTGTPVYPKTFVEYERVTDEVWAITASGTADLRVTVIKNGGAVRSGRVETVGVYSDFGQPSDVVTVTTTGNTDSYAVTNYVGTLSGVDCSATDALAASDTNYVTFSLTNLGQAGAGSAAMLAATDANTTKATGGTALAAHAKRSLTVTGTAANLIVAAGDRLRLRAAATGTLGGAVTGFKCTLRFVRLS